MTSEYRIKRNVFNGKYELFLTGHGYIGIADTYVEAVRMRDVHKEAREKLKQ